jgi:hypothetical protein
LALEHIIGVDHVVIPVRDLDAAARHWSAAGFTLSPHGKHSEHMGTSNYTIVFGHDYMELMGVDHPTPHNQPTIAFLQEREGLERAAFTTDDAAALAQELKSHGFAAEGPIAFGRPVPLPGGGTSEARFQVTTWPTSEAPGGLRIFACQHLTREAVWIPELQRHANGAQRLVRLEIMAADPKSAAAHMGRLIDREPVALADGFRVPSGGHRADFEFLSAAAFAARYPQDVRRGAVTIGPAAIVIASGNLNAARSLPGAVAHGGLVSLPATRTTGVIVSFAAG